MVWVSVKASSERILVLLCRQEYHSSHQTSHLILLNPSSRHCPLSGRSTPSGIEYGYSALFTLNLTFGLISLPTRSHSPCQLASLCLNKVSERWPGLLGYSPQFLFAFWWPRIRLPGLG